MSGSGEFAVLSAEGTDRQQWMEAWRATGCEPFAHPSYVALFCAPGDDARCAVLRQDTGTALLPLVLRPLDGLEWMTDPGWWDASSPYGYGGPFLTGHPDQAALGDELTGWMSASNVASAFIRLALGASFGAPPPALATASAQQSRPNVVVDLTRPPDAQWRHYEHKVRKNVNKALRSGLTVEIHRSFTSAAEFTELYLQTMDRRRSSSWYRFDEQFFTNLAERLDGSFVVAEVRDPSGRLVSAELVLTSDRNMYSFLGGTRREFFPHAPNDLLKHAVIEHGRQAGAVAYVLGGGFDPDDGIFRYKKSFDPSGVVPFETRHVVSDTQLYFALIAQRTAFDFHESPGSRLDAHYFPRYRAPALTCCTPTEGLTNVEQ